MAVKIDRETLAISTLVGAMMIYFFTRKEESEEDVETRRNNEEANELEQGLNQLTAQYDALRDELYGRSPHRDLDLWVREELNDILKTANQYRQNAAGNTALVEQWFTRLDEIAHAAQGHLRQYAEAQLEKEAYEAHDRQGTTHQTLNLTKIQNTLNMHNIDRRTAQQVHNVDNRKFAQIDQRIEHHPHRVEPLAQDAFATGGVSGSAAVRDMQQLNSDTTTNAIEARRPGLPGKGTAHQPIQQAILLEADETMRLLEAPSTTDNMNSAPAPNNDNKDKPPAQKDAQVMVHNSLQAPVKSDSFNEETAVQETLTSDDPLWGVEFRHKISTVDGLIDSYESVPLSSKTKGEYVSQKNAIEALFLEYDREFNEGPHADQYYTARQRWVSRMADIKAEVEGSVRISKEALSTGEKREGRRQKTLKEQKKRREEELNKRRERDRSAEREQAFEEAVRRGEVPEELHPDGRKRSASTIEEDEEELDFTKDDNRRRLGNSDFIQ